MIPVCLILLRWHVLAAVIGGAMAYTVALAAIGGLRWSELRIVLGRD